MNDEQISALLRLKRHETPPPGYFDRLLVDVQRRQRAELLRRPLWKIALERFQTFFSEHSMSPMRYAGAVASVVTAGLITASFFHAEQGAAPGSGPVAAATAPEVPAAKSAAIAAVEASRLLTERSRALRFPAQPPLPYLATRYVMDQRPAVYEPPQSF